MQYNETIFGEKIAAYHSSSHTNELFSFSTKNISVQSLYHNGVELGGNFPDDLYYWQINADSPYSAMSYKNRSGSSGAYNYNKYDGEKNSGNIPIVLATGKPKRDSDYNFDIAGSFDGNVSMHNTGAESLYASKIKVTNNSAPNWYRTDTLPSTIPSQGFFNGTAFITDFNYNNVIAEILVGTDDYPSVTLANYMANSNTAANRIKSIGVKIYAGSERSGNNKTRISLQYPTYNENGVQLTQNVGFSGIVTDYRYKVPQVVKTILEYPYDELCRTETLYAASDYMLLFTGTCGTSATTIRQCYLLEEDKWELLEGATGFTLKKSGNDVYNDDDFNYIRKLIAYLGFWFSDGGNISALLGEDALDYGDPENVPTGVYQAVIEEGVTTGDFIPLAIARDNEQSKWGKDWREKNGYDGRSEGGGDKPKPTPDPNPIQLQTPGFSLAVDNGSVCYTIDKAEWRRIWDDIYGGSKKNWKQLIEGLSLYGANPLNAILNYRWYPFEIAGTTQQPIRLGATIVKPQSHTYLIINNTASALISSNIAEFWIGEYSNFMWTKKTKCRIFLPFYGYYELPMSQVMAKTVGIQFQYNLPDDTGVWAIYFDSHIYDYVECSPFIEIPITGDNSLQIAAAKAQRNLSIALTVGTAVATAGIGFAAAAPGIASIGAAAAESAWAYGGSSVAAGLANIGPLMGEGLLTAGQIGAAIGGAGAITHGGVKTANTVMQSALQIGNLSTNVPIHSSGSDTTFLHLPMQPYIEFFTNNTIDGFNESQYKLKTGIACDMWKTTSAMPDDTLLAATGTADMDTSGMTLAEIQELNQILQSGFYK